MAVRSAGVLLYRISGESLVVLLAHPGGPFWRRRDLGAWSIPKGELQPGESAEAAARREFSEELGAAANGALTPLGQVRQRGGKEVEAFALEGEFEVGALRSATFELEWPPRSGKRAAFPEIDRAEWFSLPRAREKILPSQQPFLNRLEERLARTPR